MDRLQFGRYRRERALCPLARWQRRAATDNERRRHLLLPADLVARQQETALERSVATTAICRSCDENDNPSRSRQIRRNRRVQLVSRQSVDHEAAAADE